MNISAESPRRGTAFELKGRMQTLSVMHLWTAELEAISVQLGQMVRQAPQFFDGVPLVLDLQELGADGGGLNLPHLVGMLKGYGLIPLGLRGGSTAQESAARAMGLALFKGQTRREEMADETTPGDSRPEPPTRPQPPPPAVSRNLIVTRPVRSGQQVYARGGDLIVVGAVSSGAEVLADGNIHVYGALRGRALAGVSGDAKARIFCQDMDAELVSVAGQYRVNERLKPTERGRAVQVYLDDGRFAIEPLFGQ